MKKLIISGLAMFMSLTSVMAQEETGIGNHLGWGVGFGTEGFNASIATDLTQYAELEFGVNYAPGFSRKSDGGVFHSPEKGAQRQYLHYEGNREATIDVKTSINRATLDFKGSVYPFATNENFSSDLFVSLGISFASKEIATIKGSCTSQGISYENEEDKDKPLFIRAGKYMLPIDKTNGELVANGSCQVNSVRPYVGLGYGRLVPKNKLGFRVEAGCQFAGSVKVFYDGDNKDNLVKSGYIKNDGEVNLLSKYNIDDDSTPKKFMNFFSVYPVLKVSLRGKFF